MSHELCLELCPRFYGLKGEFLVPDHGTLPECCWKILIPDGARDDVVIKSNFNVLEVVVMIRRVIVGAENRGFFNPRGRGTLGIARTSGQ